MYRSTYLILAAACTVAVAANTPVRRVFTIVNQTRFNLNPDYFSIKLFLSKSNFSPFQDLKT